MIQGGMGDVMGVEEGEQVGAGLHAGVSRARFSILEAPPFDPLIPAFTGMSGFHVD
jgi:hypothetical protein